MAGPRSANGMVNGLHWVRGEIDASLHRARNALEQHFESLSQGGTADAAPLGIALRELQQVCGSLTMIQCHGAGLLAAEMVQLLERLAAGSVPARDPAYAALSGATLQLADYLDLLIHGERDSALVLQPLINELRLARGQAVLTESQLFSAQSRARGPGAAQDETATPPAAGAAQGLARRELPLFQAAFLQWFRGQNADAALLRMSRVADAVAVNCGAAALRDSWDALAVLAESLRTMPQPDSLDLKRLFGRAGSLLKTLAESGEDAAAAQLGEVPQQLLFQLARLPQRSARASALLARAQVDAILPDPETLGQLRRRMRGPNTSMLERLYQELRHDFAVIKDGIDLAVRTAGRASVDAAPLRERLQRLANMLGTLGLPAPRQALLNQIQAIARPPEAAAWMDVATAILRVEHSLEEALFRALGHPSQAQAPRSYEQIENEIPHARELRESRAALLRESLIDFARVKAGVDAFIKTGQRSALADAPRLLREVAAGLHMLGREAAAALVRKLETHARQSRLDAAGADHARFERYADAIACVEVYLEALRDALPDPERILEDLTAYLERLSDVAAAAPSTARSDEPAAAHAEPVASPPAEAPPAAADPEIRQIFLEEAGEVLADLQRSYATLRREPGNRAALSEARRAFHTLKGSGRMVDARRISQTGWALEQLLNRCLDGQLTVRGPVLETVEQALALLPGLIEDFRNGAAEENPRSDHGPPRSPASAVAQPAPIGPEPVDGSAAAPDMAGARPVDDPVAGLIRRAGELAAHRSGVAPDLIAVFRDDARERLGFVRRWLDAQGPGAASYEVEPELIRAFHTLRGSAAVVKAEGLSQLAGQLESYLDGQRLDGRSLPPAALSLLADALVALRNGIEAANPAEQQGTEPDGWSARIAQLQSMPAPATAPAVRPAVNFAYADAALDALQALEQQVRAWAAAPARSAAAELRAGCADLTAAAVRAPCLPMARVGEALVERLNDWTTGAAPEVEFFATLLEVLEGLYQQLDAYRDGPLSGDGSDWVARVQTLPRPPLDEAESSALPPVEPLDAELLEIFCGEAEELLGGLDQQLAMARRDPQDPDAAAGLRRHLHTLKGSARTAGAQAIGAEAHRLENLLEAGQPPETLHAQLALGFDRLRGLLDRFTHGERPGASAALAALRSAGASAPPLPADVPPAAAATLPAAPPASPPAEETPRESASGEEEQAATSGPAPPTPAAAAMPTVIEQPAPALEAALPTATLASAPAPVDEALTDTGALAPDAASWAPELFWRPQDEETGQAGLRRESARVPVEALDKLLNEASETSIHRSRLEECNAGLRLQLAEMTQTVIRIREQLRMLDLETEAQIAARARGGSAGAPDRGHDRYGQEFDPLELDRYSRMQELSRALAESVADLASLQATMDQSVSEADALLLQQSRINTEVQQGLMSALMVPFSRQVQRLLRVVHQTAQQNGKQAEATFSGVEAELDRKVLERISAPLEHLLRNAVVHGIELPAERALAGKPAAGSIQVSLRREGAQLLVEVADDGRGLDLAAIRDKALERGLLAHGAELPDEELTRFIFEPGFSTARRLTHDAGRGIGMDVVASEIKQLGGTLELRNEAGRGLRFLLRLPLTLAVSQALLVGAGAETYALPLPGVEGIVRIPRLDARDQLREDGPLLAYGGRGYKVHALSDFLGLPRELEGESRTLIAILLRFGEGLGSGERRVALIVDALYGNREIISKPVGPQVGSVAGIAGGTVLADGRVVLILDVPALLAERARRALIAGANAARVEPPATSEVRDTIVVVDDSITMRRVAERLLSRNGYRVVTAKDGLDAIAVLRGEMPATVLLDIEMPRADGFEVAAFIRNDERLKHVPIIMITSRSGEKHRERARSLGVNRYLIKPYQEDQLLAEVNAVRRGL